MVKADYQAWKELRMSQLMFQLMKQRREQIRDYLSSTEYTPESLARLNRLVGTLDVIDELLDDSIYDFIKELSGENEDDQD